ncbi:hypothetical protein GAR96_08550 [Salmonella enterica]|nr:hypothetical protein [Salmonella enterica subsp. enterica serovar Sandiego]EAZ7387867.1 hypothetical protein [Salmonella enterica]EDD5420075.1 hypothetical protein [Salmonella enterica subsp. enterica serovar Enteritidis]EBB0977312.1 hypothetical protein [Salmonella enterica]EBB2381501.1 hypothetical protein [Salmonella enterica]
MKITQWLKSLIHTEQREMPDMKDIVTDDMVKNALRSDTVSRMNQVLTGMCYRSYSSPIR